MTFQADLSWKQIDLLHRSSVAYQYSRYALGLKYEMLPQDVIHVAKRCVVDAFGCGIGGYDAPGRSMCEETLRELGGVEEATVFGSGLRTNAFNAAFLNSLMVRFLDYNDMGGGLHNSDAIASILAVSERQKASGPDFITALVISYELGARVAESLSSAGSGGWNLDFRAGLTMPPTLGRLMGLDEDQIANAVGICASGSHPLNILDTAGEERVQRKDLRFGWVACDAILSCMLAKKGFTGPVRVVEGEKGISRTMFQGQMDLDVMTDFSGWRILDTYFKGLCADYSEHGHLYATLAIVKEQNLKPSDIAAVRVTMRNVDHTRPTFSNKYARNAEGADHTPWFTTAVAIKDRSVSPDSAHPERFVDPVILDLIEKITVVPNLGMPEAGRSLIVTKDGRRFEKSITTPHGRFDDQLSDKELEEKFRDMASAHMDQKQIRKALDAIWGLEKLRDASELAKLMVFAKPH